MIKAKLTGFSDVNEFVTICNINNDKTIVSINKNELSKKHHDKIIKVLNEHFSSLSIKELKNKLI